MAKRISSCGSIVDEFSLLYNTAEHPLLLSNTKWECQHVNAKLCACRYFKLKSYLRGLKESKAYWRFEHRRSIWNINTESGIFCREVVTDTMQTSSLNLCLEGKYIQKMCIISDTQRFKFLLACPCSALSQLKTRDRYFLHVTLTLSSSL